MEKILSIIIPCYNVEKYVYACLESCIKQKIEPASYELIVINDGSTDNTIMVVDQFCSLYADVEVRIVNQANKGLSGARNAGLSAARGEYILFLDSDDTLVENTIQDILSEAKGANLDMMWFQHMLVDEIGNTLELPERDRKENVSQFVQSGKEFLLHDFNHSCMVCMFIFKRKFLISNQIIFTEGLYLEDVIFTLTCLKYCERIKYMPVCAYKYLMRSDSIMRDPKKISKRAYDAMIVADKLMDVYRDDNNPKTVDWVKDFANSIIQYNLRRLVKNADKEAYSKCVSMLKRLNMFPLPAPLVSKQKILTQLFNISPLLYWHVASILK